MKYHARIQKIFSGGGGGAVPNSQKGSDGKFNMAKTDNLAIQGGGPDPLSPPLDPPKNMCPSLS